MDRFQTFLKPIKTRELAANYRTNFGILEI